MLEDDPTPEGSQRGIFYPKTCDITDERAVQDVFGWVDAELGGVSVLVNNAGIIMRSSLLGEYYIIIFIGVFIHPTNGQTIEFKST